MKTAADYRIENIEKIHVNGVAKKSFRVFEKKNNAFVYVGSFYAPAKTANSQLWKIASAAE